MERYAFWLWNIIGGLWGIAIGLLFGGGRLTVFGVILGIGMVWLMWLNTRKARESASRSRATGLRRASSPASKPAAVSDEEARAWLDDFLKRQQSGDKKQ